MARKNRAYKKLEPHRDARLFVIVAEGKREDAYFRFFAGKSLRLRIKIVPRDENRSAPNHFLERLRQFQERGEWDPQQDDRLWFVLDVDRWKRGQIEELRGLAQQYANWHIAISNPCFEVWLLFHFLPDPAPSPDCQALKQQLHRISGGQSGPADCAPRIAIACDQARQADLKPGSSFPAHMRTKLYVLADEMRERLGLLW